MRGLTTALVTPFTADGALDLQTFKKLVDWQIASGVDGLVVAGTTGEAPTLTLEEYSALISAALERVKSAGATTKVLAGTGTNCTRTTIEKTRLAQSLGVHAAMVVVPFYNKPTQEGMYRHFAAVAAAVPDLPIILYNVPGRTVVDMSPATVGRLAKLPNVKAVKEATSDLSRVAELRKEGGAELVVLWGEDDCGCEAVLAGADGIISVTSNVAPEVMVKMVAHAVKRETEAARAENEKAAGLHRELFREPNPVGAKWGLHVMGRMPVATPRLPLVELSEESREGLKAALVQAGCKL